MPGYILQGKTSENEVIDIPLAAMYDSDGNKIKDSYASKDEPAAQKAQETADSARAEAQKAQETADSANAAAKSSLQPEDVEISLSNSNGQSLNTTLKKGTLLEFNGFDFDSEDSGIINIQGTRLKANGSPSGFISGDITFKGNGITIAQAGKEITFGAVAPTWDNIDDKPSWVGSSKPSYTWSEIGGALPSNIVTTDTQQTISGEKTFTKSVTIDNGELLMVGSAKDGYVQIRNDSIAMGDPVSKQTSTYRLPDRGGMIALEKYDTIISNQEEFDAWCAELDAETYTGKSLLILEGEYTREYGKAIVLPSCLRQIDGLGKVVININYDVVMDRGSTVSQGAFSYQEKVYEDDSEIVNYSISNITVKAKFTRKIVSLPGGSVQYFNGPSSNTVFVNVYNLKNCTAIANDGGIGFSSCNTLTNCRVDRSGDPYMTSGFYNCNNLLNCKVLVAGGNKNEGELDSPAAFDSCKNLVNCSGYLQAIDDTWVGSSQYVYKNCERLMNCTAEVSATSKVTNDLYAFANCRMMSNCEGTGSDKTIIFDYCQMCSNCYGDGGTVWGSNNELVDKDTCEGYEG